MQIFKIKKPSTFLLIIFLSNIFIACSNNKEEKQTSKSTSLITKETIDSRDSLQKQLDDLLRYNGKECKAPITHLSIGRVSYDIDSSSHTTATQKHTNVYSNGNGSYTTSSYTTGGNVKTDYYGYTIHARINNNSDKTIDAYFEFNAPTQYYSNGLFGLFSGIYGGNGVSETEHVSVPPEGLDFSKYYKLNGWISGTLNTSLSSYGTADDNRYSNAKTIEDYHNYLQEDGCHYHITEAKAKIRALFSKQALNKALAIKNHEDRIVALEEYLKVFKNNKEAKRILLRDKRMVELLKKTETNTVIVWEEGNPLLYSFKSPLSHDKYDNNLLFFVDDYMRAAEKKYKKEVALKEKTVPQEPIIENFGKKPNKQMYPIKPYVEKDEFEKQKDFLERKSKLLTQWEQEKATIDNEYNIKFQAYKKNQKEQYELAHTQWLKTKKQIIDENTKAKQEHQNKLKSMIQYTQYWLWQATVLSMGTKEFKFKKLQYNSEKEFFEYVVEGGELNFRFEGTIAIPIDQAKEFKEYVKNNLSIVFKIQDNKLFIKDFIYKNKPSAYDATSKTKLVLIDEKQLKKERKKVADAIAQEKKRIANEKARQEYIENNRIYVDKHQKLMWQDNPDSKNLELSWNNAKKYCKKLSIHGYRDWYLPSSKQLSKLHYQNKFLKNVVDNWYWSNELNRTRSHAVAVSSNKSWFLSKGGKMNVRCVRNRR